MPAMTLDNVRKAMTDADNCSNCGMANWYGIFEYILERVQEQIERGELPDLVKNRIGFHGVDNGDGLKLRPTGPFIVNLQHIKKGQGT